VGTLARVNLAGGSIELSRFLAENGRVVFRASGYCMYPNVKHGDLLLVEPRRLYQIEIGDVAVFRRGGSFYAHRTIEKGEDALGPYLVTKPDQSTEGHDDISRDADLLGIVRGIQRGKRNLKPILRNHKPSKVRFLAFRLRVSQWRLIFMKQMQNWFSWMLSLRIFRSLFRLLFVLRQLDLRYSIHIPAKLGSLPLFQKLFDNEFETFRLGPAGNPVEQWKIVLQVNKQRGASLEFAFRPPGCPYEGWWLAAVEGRRRYRSIGLLDALFQKAERILTRSNVATLAVDIPEEASWVRAWCKAIGFQEFRATSNLSIDQAKGRALMVKNVLREDN